MKILKAKFLLSCTNLKSCPIFNLPEFALLGRSNVGKSTFINTVTNQSKLAKTSNTPGKTRLINFFEITTDKNSFIVADLPGYGYAKVSKKEQASWQKNLEEYLLKRKEIVSNIQFIDSRHDILKNDVLMHTWLKYNNLKVFNILTKADYISKNELNKKMLLLKREFNNDVIPFSSKNKIYIDEVLNYIYNLTTLTLDNKNLV